VLIVLEPDPAKKARIRPDPDPDYQTVQEHRVRK
jgi:hypothetical protein